MRYVEIATQTMNLSNVLTNFNSNLTSSNNTSDPCSVQNVSPTTSIAPSAPVVATQSPLNKFNDDPLYVQSSNPKNNNGHCIRTDSNENNRHTDDEVHHQLPEMCCVSVLSLPETIDDANAPDAIINTDDSIGGKDDDNDDNSGGHVTLQQHFNPNEITVSNVDETPIVTTTSAKTSPTEADSSVDESLDISKNHTSTDGINGKPANDLRV